MSSAILSASPHYQSGLSFARQGRAVQTPSSAAADEALRQVIAKRRERNRSRRSPTPRDSAIADMLGGLTASLAESKNRGVVKTGRSAKSRAKHRAVVIPDRYAATTSTPLSVEVTGASATFDLVVQP
ncbi:MAG: hypothetical protein KGR24_00520 [Planctomycetes bacterium]|nr:hypothetical protein [Planctomycetota bacterium]